VTALALPSRRCLAEKPFELVTGFPILRFLQCDLRQIVGGCSEFWIDGQRVAKCRLSLVQLLLREQNFAAQIQRRGLFG